MFTIGLIINPFAGVGGPAGLKGSDGAQTVATALSRGVPLRATERARQALQALQPLAGDLLLCGFAGDMGETLARELNLSYTVLGQPAVPSTADDTRAAAQALLSLKPDLLVFAGGDGTARDICAVVGEALPVLGIPAGVKMHSGVYAVSPAAAGKLLYRLVQGGAVDLGQGEVRDIDEEAFRQGQVRSRYFGQMSVPQFGQFVQQVKMGGQEVEALVLADIAAHVVEIMDSDTLYLIGPGTTTRAVMEELGLANTLLGVDAVCNNTLLAMDLDEPGIRVLLEQHQGPVKILLTAIGGQGHIIGRGNQQISPAILRRAGPDGLLLIASNRKITALAGRPLLLDTGDRVLDETLAGLREVITGYHQRILYRVSAGTE